MIPPLRYYLEKVLRDMGGGISRTGISPDFRAAWLSHRQTKVAIFGHFSANFPVFGAKEGGKKLALNPGTRISLVKALPQ